MLEGAVARSEATGKVAAIDAAIDKTEAELGLRLPISLCIAPYSRRCCDRQDRCAFRLGSVLPYA
eukprot:2723804-Rhodomonas_salina.1